MWLRSRIWHFICSACATPESDTRPPHQHLSTIFPEGVHPKGLAIVRKQKNSAENVMKHYKIPDTPVTRTDIMNCQKLF
jgi:hypothetical protein